MSTAMRPLPPMDAVSRPFWEGLRARTIRLPHCEACGHRWFPPAATCPRCLSDRIAWRPASGRGTVWSFTVFHKAYLPGFEIPYNVAVVELDEGVRLFTNLVEVPLDAIRVGMPVEAVFEDVTDGVTLLKFRPA
ncbi:MAG: OB-fold domain-containing protein [Actinomycetia bacterium]|nr:OB-fold domain-containing protein [Actinomycetes bacterium]